MLTISGQIWVKFWPFFGHFLVNFCPLFSRMFNFSSSQFLKYGSIYFDDIRHFLNLFGHFSKQILTISNFGQILVKFWCQILVSNFGVKFWCQILVSNFDVKLWCQIVVSNCGQVLVKFWSNFGVKLWSNCGLIWCQIVVKFWSNCGQIVVKLWSIHFVAFASQC